MESSFITALIFVPFVLALIISLISNDKIRGKIVYIGGGGILLLAVTTALLWAAGGGEALSFDLPASKLINDITLVGDIVLMLLIIWLSIKHHKAIISLLSIVQTAIVVWIELFGPEITETPHMRMDWLTFIMILIIGVIGVLIGVYAVGYMRGYHVHHSEVKNRSGFFLAMMFVFYGAMFGLVTSANLLWLDFFWEVTSVCSFLLIGYTGTKEAVDNSFRALWMNLLGGLGIALAILYAVCSQGTVDLHTIVQNATESGKMTELLPIAFLAFAALTKSAQLPFSKWLLGAMVAPTPSSALLHSATMVKAGVYMLLRLSIAMSGNAVGQMVYLIGGFTFFVASLLAISQSDGKKVLAYSTISNLGLITACTGMGFQETIWAAVFLIIFHAVSKSMLFQCVGAIENATGSRDIEDMQGLSSRIPKLALILMVGIVGMFLAPFGMLISKWAALKAFVDAQSTLMVLFIVFGSSSTMLYWTMWLSKILGTNQPREKDVTQRNEYASMFFHASMIILLCIGLPFLSKQVVEPLIVDMFGKMTPVLSDGNIILMVIMVVAIFVVPTINYFLTKNVNEKEVMSYMGGANAGDDVNFIDSFGDKKKLQVSNWYLENWFGEMRLFTPAVLLSTLIVVVFLCVILGGAL